MKELTLLTLDEALQMNELHEQSRGCSLAAQTVTRRLSDPSPVSLQSRTREYALPPKLLPGLFSIQLDPT